MLNKIKIFICAIVIFSNTNLLAQKDLVISGGNSVSSFVCANQVVYVWGNNGSGAGIGILGTGGASTIYSTPQKVTFPNDALGNTVTAKQVSSGSGSHFLSLDCNNQVWAWGNDSKGQAGNGVSGGVVTTPSQVKLGTGPLAGTHWDDGFGHLAHVSVVYAGNNSSFAILD